jgi:hypothetical protein
LCFRDASGQTVIGRQLVDRYPIDANGDRTYGLTWLPADYATNPEKRYPLIIFLHGRAEAGRGVGGLKKLIVSGALPQRIAEGFDATAVNPADGQRYSFIVVSPQAGDWSYRYQQVRYILADVLKRYRVDTRRIYVTGCSAGGEGALSCVTNDSAFARNIAAVVTCSSTELSNPGERESVPLIGARYGVKLWCLAGEKDGLTEVTKRYISAVNAAKPLVPAKFTYIEKIGHSSWVEGYNPLFRPRRGYYGKFADYAIVMPDNNGSAVPGTGPDSLNVYEWMLLYSRSGAIAGLPELKKPEVAKVETVAERRRRGPRPGSPANPEEGKVAERRNGNVGRSPERERGGGCGHGHRYVLTPNQDSAFYGGRTAMARYHPGDTLVFPSRYTWTFIALDGYVGSPACPLVLTNGDGETHTTTGISIANSSYVKVTGSGVKGIRYGFYLTGKHPELRGQGPFAVVITNRSKNIEVERVYIHNVGIGFDVKSEGECADSMNYPNWVLDSISIHDNRIVGIWNEGMYLGNTSPDNAANSYDPRPIDCGGQRRYPMPMRVGNIRVYDNYVDSCGRGGIQLASASKGMSEIFRNVVRHCGMNGDDAQGTGISVGAYTHAYIHDNVVTNTYTWGIASLGGSGTGVVLRIENNRIDSSGYLEHYDLAHTDKKHIDPGTEPIHPAELSWPYPIELGTRPTLFKDSTTFWIRGNILGRYKNRGAAIQLHDGSDGITRNGNIVAGNKLADGRPAEVYADRSKREIHYSTGR